jgi:hypothetical protein
VTLREDLNRRVRKAQIITLCGFLAFMLGIFVAQAYPSLWPLTVLAFAVFFGGTLYRMFGVRCPHCSRQIGMAIAQSGGGFSVPRDFRFCPFCGTSLDTHLDATQQT